MLAELGNFQQVFSSTGACGSRWLIGKSASSVLITSGRKATRRISIGLANWVSRKRLLLGEQSRKKSLCGCPFFLEHAIYDDEKGRKRSFWRKLKTGSQTVALWPVSILGFVLAGLVLFAACVFIGILVSFIGVLLWVVCAGLGVVAPVTYYLKEMGYIKKDDESSEKTKVL